MILTIATHQRNKVWLSDLTLFQDIVNKSPNKPRPHLNLGNAYYFRGNWEQAGKQWQLTADLAQSRPRTLDAALFDYQASALSNIAAVAIAQRDYGHAENLLTSLLPQHETPEILTNLSLVYMRTGQFGLALQMMNQAIAKYPGRGELIYNRGDLYSALKRCDLANKDYYEAYRLTATPTLKRCA